MTDSPEPPAGGRFPKGKSGNPKGRPRKIVQPQASAFDIVIDRTLAIHRNGEVREVTVEEALEQRTYQDAIAGNRTARREVLKMIAKRERAITAKAVKPGSVETRIEHADNDSINTVLQILDIAHLDARHSDGSAEYVRMLLEPWAVEAALRRRGAPKMSQKDLDYARRMTRDADGIAWPGAGQE